MLSRVANEICAEGLPDSQPRRKAVLKTRAVQTFPDRRTPSNRAKRLDCGAFTAAFSVRRDCA